MAKIEDILHKYKEESILNVIKSTIFDRDGGSFFNKGELCVIDLVKVDNDELLFSYGDSHFRVSIDDKNSMSEISPDGESRYNHIFWVEPDGVQGKEITINFLKTGRRENHDSLDIAYGDDILFDMVQRRHGKEADVSRDLYSCLAFNAGKYSYLFIETFPNSENNFRIHGLKNHAEVSIENGKWVIHKLVKKPFPSRYSDFMMYNPIRYKELDFKTESAAKEAFESINLRDKTSGDTIIALWEKYSEIERSRAEEFKNRVGKLRFRDASQRKEGKTVIRLEPTDEQKEILKEESETILDASFDICEKGNRVSFKSFNPSKMEVVIIDDDYPIAENASGELEVNIKGDEIVERRRSRALDMVRKNATLVLINLRFAIEGESQAMLPKTRREKPLSDKTRAFMWEQFGIKKLTDDQEKAVDIAINTPDIAVIQGPPGTGKSTVVAVICHRLMELAEKRDKTDKVILVSAFQNDTVEHTASKIYTNGLPTIKIGKEVQGVRAEDAFVGKMRDAIDNAISKLAPKCNARRISKQLADIRTIYETENNVEEAIAKISRLILSQDIDMDLLDEWNSMNRSIKVEDDEKDKLISALKGLRTDVESYRDDGFRMVRKLLATSLPFNEEEKNILEDTPMEDDVTDDYLEKLKQIQGKYLSALLSEENHVNGGVNMDLSLWLDDAIEKFKEKEEKSYEDKDTFITATLEALREDLEGNVQHVRDAILHYAQSVAATNQIAGSREVSESDYENVILEEAARSNPLDLLIPMVRASERIIMVGDQKQLPHLLENDIVDEAVKGDYELRKKYEESLFGIIFNNLEQANPVRRITLTNQFRMHPVIGDFISNTYYDREIKSDMVNVESKLHGLSLPWAKGKVAVFCDVPESQGTEERKGKSKTRKAEAERIVKLLDELFSDDAFEELNVGIITFYSKQADLIYEVASKNGLGYTEQDGEGGYKIKEQYRTTSDGREKLRIGSVDSFQGKEFDVVILSTVRSNTYRRSPENNLKVFGFLTLENRLNVAFSRAQKLIIVVGDRNMFTDEYAEIYVRGLYEFNKLTEGEYGNRIR